MTEGDGYIIPRARIWNNIFLVDGRASMEERDGGGDFRNNAYHGNWKKLPADPSPIKADPMFENPAPAGDLASTFRNYALRSGSPCRANGLVIPNHGGRDLTGNSVPESTPPDLGALQTTENGR